MTESTPESGAAQGGEVPEAPNVNDLQRQLQAVQQAATVAESNELLLHRRLSSYIDADLENLEAEARYRDARITELQKRVAELEAELEARVGEEPEVKQSGD